MNDNVIPLHQPAWKVRREVTLTEKDLSIAQVELCGLMSRCPYPMGAPSPKGHLELILPTFRLRFTLSVYSHGAIAAAGVPDRTVLLSTVKMAKLSEESETFVFALFADLHTRAYAIQQFMPGLTRQEEGGEEKTYHWSFLPRTGYERLHVTAYVPQPISSYPSY